MTFPAEISFRRDRTLKPRERRVYEYLTTILDLHELRSVKSQLHSDRCGIDRADFSRALDTLTAAGYLIEHPRDMYNVRVFTLAYSVKENDASDA